MTQAEALEILKAGSNVFLTGPAGSGKTYLLNQFIEHLKAAKIRVGVTASTGIAATHIGGRTIHAWSGLHVLDKSLSRKEVEKRVKNLMYKDELVALYNETQVLIIDEISMLDAEYLELLNSACQAMRQSPMPFGGLQLVLCGDFFQLPPVSTVERRTHFAFKARAWQSARLRICYVDEQQRYIDNQYVGVLNDIRHSQVTAETLKILKSRLKSAMPATVQATRLYTRNIDVTAVNDIELDNLPTPEKLFTMRTFYKTKEHMYLRDQLVKHCMAPYHLILKIGAVVMFVRNRFDERVENAYVNGTMGKVVDFVEEEDCFLPVILTNDGHKIIARPQTWSYDDLDEQGRYEAVASITQLPLRLAWAITVHKSQGMSMDEVVTDLSGAFEYGMGYVALSRVRSLKGLSLLGLNRKALQVNPEITAFDDKLRQASAQETTG